MATVDHKPITVTFAKAKEGVEKIRYHEIHPGGAVGSFYLSRLAIHYMFGGEIPDTIKVTVSPS